MEIRPGEASSTADQAYSGEDAELVATAGDGDAAGYAHGAPRNQEYGSDEEWKPEEGAAEAETVVEHLRPVDTEEGPT